MCVFSAPMVAAGPVSARFYTTNDSKATTADNLTGLSCFNTVDTIKQNKNFIQFELNDANEDFVLEHSRTLPVKAIENAELFLEDIIDEHVQLPHITANALGQVGLTWDSLTHRMYLAVDESGELFLTLVNRNNLNECDFMQRNIEERNEIIGKIKTVL